MKIMKIMKKKRSIKAKTQATLLALTGLLIGLLTGTTLLGTTLLATACTTQSDSPTQAPTPTPTPTPTQAQSHTPAAPAPAAVTATMTGGTQVVAVAVTADGFVPASINVHTGDPVKLVVTRSEERTCATDIVIKDLEINKPLPLNQAVEVTFTPTKAGKIRFACSMDMIAGEILVQ